MPFMESYPLVRFINIQSKKMSGDQAEDVKTAKYAFWGAHGLH
jgi:hypothetical protein